MSQGAEEIRDRCKAKTKIEARIEEVDDVVREESEEQRKHDEEEEFGERLRASTVLL